MKIASITCVKNEAEILETFIRVNSSFVDTFVFVDDSIDDSEKIYKLMAAEGFNILVLHRSDKHTTFRQDYLIFLAINYLKTNSHNFNYYLPLDVDEFPSFKNLGEASNALKKIPSDHIGIYEWETYIPISLDFDVIQSNALSRCFGKRQPEGRRYQKIIIPHELAGKIQLAPGAHFAKRLDGVDMPEYHLTEKLGHFPVRSPKQILQKNLSALYGLLRKNERAHGEGYHTFDLMKKIVSGDYIISLELLQTLAVFNSNPEPVVATSIGSPPDWIRDYTLQHRNHINSHFEKILTKIIMENLLNPLEKERIRDFKAFMEGQFSPLELFKFR
jgi:hypothetical protein